MKNIIIALIVFISAGLPKLLLGQSWQQLSDSAKFLSGEKNYEAATQFYLRAKEKLQHDSALTKTYIDVCDTLGLIYQSNFKYKNAELLYIESKKLKEKLLGKENRAYASSCNSLGYLYDYLWELNNSGQILTDAKQILERVVGREDPDYAVSCHNLALHYYNMGEFEKAKYFCQQSMRIRENFFGKFSQQYLKSFNLLAGIYVWMSNYKEAESIYLQVIPMKEKALGKNNLDYAESCLDFAQMNINIGNYKKAGALTSESMQIVAKVAGKNNLEYARNCCALGVICTATGSFEKAESLFLEQKRINEFCVVMQGNDNATNCFGMGNLYMLMGQYEKVKPLYITWIKIMIGDSHGSYFYNHTGVYVSQCALAWYYVATHQYTKAKMLLLQVKQTAEKLNDESVPEYSSILKALAELYWREGNYSKAESMLLQPHLKERVRGEEYLSNTRGSLLAKLYLDMCRYKKAEPLLKHARRKEEKFVGINDPYYIDLCNDFGRLYWNLKKYDKANQYYQESERLQNVLLRNVFRFTSETEKISFIKKIKGLENEIFSFNTSVDNRISLGNNYDLSLSNRNLTLFSSRKLRNVIYNSKDSAVINKVNTWLNIKEQLSFWYLTPASDRQVNVNELENEADRVEKELNQLSSAFKTQQEQNNVTWKDVRQNLKPDEAAIEFISFPFFNGKRLTDSIYYVALLLTKNDTAPQLIRLCDERQLAKALNGGNTLANIESLYRPSNKNNLCYNLLWKPLEKSLTGIAKIYFAPTGLMHKIANQALPVNDHQLMGDKYQLVQLNTTAAVLDQSHNSINLSDSIYLFGGIKYDVDSTALKETAVAYHANSDINIHSHFRAEGVNRNNSWQYLPGTAYEINEIEKMGKEHHYSVSYATGAAATEESIKDMASKTSPSIVHIATHGFFFADPKINKAAALHNSIYSGDQFKNSENPLLRSGLLFAGANNAWKGHPIDGIDDGILTAYEVSNLNLPNTKLVVLSACETGLGEIKGSEGVYGLQRAFKIAGVEYLLMSLWKVPDEETSEFMSFFYKDLFSKHVITDVYYYAETMMKNKYRDQPYKWAAWILVN